MTRDFEEYVAVAWPRLLRSAWLLTGDWHRAEDLVQTVLARAYGRWSRIRAGTPDAYLRAMLATTYLSWWRRKWRGEIPYGELPERPGQDRNHDVELRHSVGAALARLPDRQRAVLMLRYHGDLTEAATADALGISVGTVKSYTARALATLRADDRLRAIVTRGGPPVTRDDTARLLDAAVPPIPVELRLPPYGEIRQRVKRRRQLAIAGCGIADGVVLVAVSLVVAPSPRPSIVVGSSPTGTDEAAPSPTPPPSPAALNEPPAELPANPVPSWRVALVRRSGTDITIYVNPPARCWIYANPTVSVNEAPRS